jgi:hypothetical protein
VDAASQSLAFGLTEQFGGMVSGEEDGGVGVHRRLRCDLVV